MSVREEHGLACPKCHDDDSLQVTFTGTCRLTSDGSEDAGDHEWEEDSAIYCGTCGHAGKVSGFTCSDDRYCVDGHETESPDSALIGGNDSFAPFFVFDIEGQDHLPDAYPTREAAQAKADELNEDED